MGDFLAAHLVRYDERKMITSPGRYERQSQPRVAGRRLDEPASGLQRPGALGGSTIDIAMRSLMEPVGF